MGTTHERMTTTRMELRSLGGNGKSRPVGGRTVEQKIISLEMKDDSK